MLKYRDVMMFVCGLIVGAASMALIAPDSGKGKVRVDSRSSIVVDPGAKVLIDDTAKPAVAAPGTVRCKYQEEPCTAWVDVNTGKDLPAGTTPGGSGTYFGPWN